MNSTKGKDSMAGARAIAEDMEEQQRTAEAIEHGLERQKDGEVFMLEVPVLDARHLTQETYNALIVTIVTNGHAGAVYESGAWVHVPEHPDSPLFPPDLAAVFKWGDARGYHWIRFDVDVGTAVPTLPTYEWED